MTTPRNSSRRDFLIKGASFVALGATVPMFLQNTVLAANKNRRGKRIKDSDRILVVLQLAGGNDGLNTIIPVTNDAYYAARPKLAIKPANTLALNSDFALPGQAVGLKRLFDDGYLSVIHGVGYPNPNRSHFKSTDIWSTASPSGKQHDGWLGRYFDNSCRGEDPPDSTTGIALMKESPLAMQGDRFMPLAFEKPESLNWTAAVRASSTGKVVTALNKPKRSDSKDVETSHEFLRRVALEARLSAEQIQAATHGRKDNSRFPNSEIGRSLQTVYRLIGADLDTRVYYLSHGGYDTHARQENKHANLMRDLGEGLNSFVQSLKARGDLDRVTVMVFSEFGRRVAENASAGTDHGAAAPMFVLGGKVNGGIHGTMPDMTNLDKGDLRFTTDFRNVYTTMLEEWLKVDPTKILGKLFPKLDLIHSS